MLGKRKCLCFDKIHQYDHDWSVSHDTEWSKLERLPEVKQIRRKQTLYAGVAAVVVLFSKVVSVFVLVYINHSQS